MLAEDLVLGAGANPPQSPDSRVLAFDYLFAPGNFSLTAFAGYDVDPLERGHDAADYGFFRSTRRQLRRRVSARTLSLRPIRRRRRAASRLRGLDRGAGRGANVSPIQSEANGESFAQVYGEFAARTRGTQRCSVERSALHSSRRTCLLRRDDDRCSSPAVRRGTSDSTDRAHRKTVDELVPVSRPHQAHAGWRRRYHEADHRCDAVPERRTRGRCGRDRQRVRCAGIRRQRPDGARRVRRYGRVPRPADRP